MILNKRTRDLVRQAGLDNPDFPIENWDNVPLAKYTELIVQTCLAHIALIGISNLENDKHGDIGWTVTTSIEMIKEHFGAEE